MNVNIKGIIFVVERY